MKKALLLLPLLLAGCQTVHNHKHFKEISLNEYDPQELLAGEIFAVSAIESRSNSHAHGKAWFTHNNDGVQVLVVAKNLTPGLHGIHIHEKGDCSALDASSAGPHYNPDHHHHGSADPHVYHMGDLGNIVISNEGIGILNLGIPKSDATNWKNIIGKSIVLHASTDDLKSQPAGDSGGRIGCGVINESHDAHR